MATLAGLPGPKTCSHVPEVRDPLAAQTSRRRLVFFRSHGRSGGLNRHGDARGLARSEDLLPRARGPRSVGGPDFAEFGSQGVAVLFEKGHEFARHGSGERLVGNGRAVARIAQYAYFVFHLHHDDGVPGAVDRLDVAHEGAKGARVGIARGVAEGAEDLDAFPGAEADARESPKVLLDPIGSVAGEAILPTAEPEEHQLEIVAARFLD